MRDGDENTPYRLARRSGVTGGSDSVVGAEFRPHPLGHRLRDFGTDSRMSLNQFTRHAEFADLHFVRVGHDSAEQVRTRSGHTGQQARHLSRRDALGGGHGLPGIHQQLHRRIVEFDRVDPEYQLAEPFVDDPLRRCDQRFGFGNTPRLRHDPQANHGIAGGDTHLGHRPAFGHIPEHLLDLRLAGPESVDLPFEEYAATAEAQADQARLHPLGEHLDHFRGNARHRREHFGAEGHPNAGGRADGVGDRFAAERELGLHAVALGHHPSTLGEHPPHLRQARFVFVQPDAGDLGQHFPREVVERRPQATGAEHDIDAFQRLAENEDVVIEVVGDGGVEPDRDAHFRKPPR